MSRDAVPFVCPSCGSTWNAFRRPDNPAQIDGGRCPDCGAFGEPHNAEQMRREAIENPPHLVIREFVPESPGASGILEDLETIRNPPPGVPVIRNFRIIVGDYHGIGDTMQDAYEDALFQAQLAGQDAPRIETLSIAHGSFQLNVQANDLQVGLDVTAGDLLADLAEGEKGGQR